MTDLTERLRTTRLLSQRNQLALQEEAATTLETLTQENARLREAGWRDIESAPREHLARFLAYAEPRSDTEQVVFEVTRYDDKWGNHIRLNEGYGSSTEWDILKRLTHWMPLPPAPARKALGGGDE